jgi:putative DNA primase/helicase
MRRRLHLIPFVVTIPPEQRDHALPEKLKTEWPGILSWMIRGCIEWQRQGLNPPTAVRAATEEYMASEDVFERWCSDCIEPAPGHWEAAADLWNSWKNWAENMGEFVGTSRRLSAALTERLLFVSQKHQCRRGYYGGRLTKRDLPGGASYDFN